MAGIFKNIANTVKKAAKDTSKAVQKAGKDVARVEIKAVKDTAKAVTRAASDTAKESVRFAKSDLGQAVLIGAVTGGVGVGAVALTKKVARSFGGKSVATTVAKPREVATVEPLKDTIHTETAEDPSVINVNRDKPRETLREIDRAGDVTTAPVTRAEVREEAGGAAGAEPLWKKWWVWLLVLVIIAAVIFATRSKNG
jgi:hypothetical protein